MLFRSTKGPDLTVLEDATAQSIPVWATAISPGAISESNQVVNFIVSNNNNALFSSQPTVSATGTLTYTPATNANGSALVSVQIHDNGGTNPGVDLSAVQTFTINVTPVNDVPGFALKLAQASASIENFDFVTVPNLPAGWTTSFSPATAAWKTVNTSADSAPNSAFAPNVNSEDTSLFSTAITVPNSGSTLTFRHSYNVESYYDGGILEIAIGGGAFQEIISAGGSFVSGGLS